MKAHTFAMLKEAHDFKQVGSARIAGRAKHAHQAFRRNVRGRGKIGEPNSCVDVIAQNCLRETDVARQHGFETFAEKFFTKLSVALHTIPNGFLKITTQGHRSLLFSQFVVLPVGDGGIDIALLALLGTAAKQDNEMRAVLAEINPVAWTKIDPQFGHAGSEPFDIRHVAKREPGQSCCHFGSSFRIQPVKPKLIRIAAVPIEIFANVNH